MGGQMPAWTFEPVVVGWLLAFAAVYGGGVFRLWRSAGSRRGISMAQVACFAAGWSTLVIALVSPLDAISDWLFSAHMVQHELLMIVAAPLIAASAPVVAAAWCFRRRRVAPVRTPQRSQLRGALLALATSPPFVWILHAVALWVWHLPLLFQAALTRESVHIVQHFCFFTTACLFWWGMAHGRYGRAGYGAAVVYIFATAVHSGVLGALLTFSSAIWYPLYTMTTAKWGLAPIEDQQLAGLFMWVPASVIFLIGGLVFLGAWIRESDRRVLIQ